MEPIILSDNTELDSYKATGLAEGFIESDDSMDILKAWSYLGQSGLAFQLQGWFGRNLESLVESGYLNQDYTVNYSRLMEDQL